MKLKELVDVNNTWSARAVGASSMLGICFLALACLHYMKIDQNPALDLGIFLIFMVATVLVLICLLFYSLFMMSETTKSMIMSHRVLSQIVENSASQFVKLYLLDLSGHPVLPVFQQHKRYDLIETYGDELERIRLKLHRKLHSLISEHDARWQCQASYDQVTELATWKLKNRSHSESLPRNMHQVAETKFLVGASR